MLKRLEFSFLSFQHRWNNTRLSPKTGTQDFITLVCGYTSEKGMSSFAALRVDHWAYASWNLWSLARVVGRP